MIFHENRLLADDSHEISYLFFFENLKRCHKFVVCCSCDWHFKGKQKIILIRLCALVAYIANTMYPDQTAPLGAV